MKIYNENILVVKKEYLFSSDFPQGFFEDEYFVIDKIKEKGFYYDRNLAESDFNYKQITSYIIFRDKNKNYFVMQRKKGHVLSEKYSIGIGGHLTKEDLTNKNDLNSWAKREFEEEVLYNGNYKSNFLGFINYDGDEIGKIHLGMVFLFEGDSSNIKIKNEHKSGILMSKEEIISLYSSFEEWSKIFIDKFIVD